MMEKYYTIQEVADNLKVSKMTIYRYIKSKKLGAIKLGKEYRISKANITKFLEDKKI